MTGPDGFAARLRPAIDGLPVRGRLHLAAWTPDAPGSPLLIDADAIVSAASTIKVPILATVLAEVAAGRLDLAQPVAAPARRADGGVLHALPSLRTLPLADLLTLMIIVSDNTATNVLIDLIGMARVNEFCAAAGLTGTVLRRAMMDFGAARRGLENTTTARDQATLLDAIAWRGLLAAPQRDFALRALRQQQFNDGLPALLPEEVSVAHKTGELPGIRHDAGIITAPDGRQAVVAVLVDEIPVAPGRGSVSPPSAPLTAVGLAAVRALSGEASAPAPDQGQAG